MDALHLAARAAASAPGPDRDALHRLARRVAMAAGDLLGVAALDAAVDQRHPDHVGQETPDPDAIAAAIRTPVEGRMAHACTGWVGVVRALRDQQAGPLGPGADGDPRHRIALLGAALRRAATRRPDRIEAAIAMLDWTPRDDEPVVGSDLCDPYGGIAGIIGGLAADACARGRRIRAPGLAAACRRALEHPPVTDHPDAGRLLDLASLAALVARTAAGTAGPEADAVVVRATAKALSWSAPGRVDHAGAAVAALFAVATGSPYAPSLDHVDQDLSDPRVARFVATTGAEHAADLVVACGGRPAAMRLCAALGAMDASPRNTSNTASMW